MSVSFSLEAEPREDLGKGASRRLRRAGKVPAILYGGTGRDPMPIMLDHNVILHNTEDEAFYTHILEVKIGGRVERAVLRDMQRHPAKPVILHLDLLRVSEDHELQVRVPLHFINEEAAPGVKQEGGAVSHHLTEVEVKCLPSNMPEFIEVDLSGLHVNQSIKLSDLKLPEGVAIVALTHGAEYDVPVASIHPGRGAAEEGEEEGEVSEE